jgi:hypothetical protein
MLTPYYQVDETQCRWFLIYVYKKGRLSQMEAFATAPMIIFPGCICNNLAKLRK